MWLAKRTKEMVEQRNRGEVKWALEQWRPAGRTADAVERHAGDVRELDARGRGSMRVVGLHRDALVADQVAERDVAVHDVADVAAAARRRRW